MKLLPTVFNKPKPKYVPASGKPMAGWDPTKDPNKSTGTNKPANWDAYKMVEAANPGEPWGAITRFVDTGGINANAQPTALPQQRKTGGGTGGGGGGRGGGGGGGGGGLDPVAQAQQQMDFLSQLLASKSYTAEPLTGMRDANNALRSNVATATAADQAAATGAYNNLDTYLQQNQVNPYANVRLQQAQRAPDMNPYLASQGVQGTNYQASNPEDQGYGAFQNVLALLGANQQAGNQSRLAESQMGRTYTGQQIGAMDNAYLYNIGTRDADVAKLEAERQLALDTEKRQAAMQLAQLIAQGARAPDLAALGLGGMVPAAPEVDPSDPLGWRAIAAAMAAQGG